MSSVNEWIVREYFETHGFLVRQPRKFQIGARPKQAEEEIDLLAVNPAAREHKAPEGMIMTGRDVRRVARAIVAVRGWHTERFSPAVLELSSEIFRLSDSYVLQKAEEMMGAGAVSKILCLPGLPAGRDLRARALEMLREKGIDGVLLFRTMLLELAAHVDVNKNYEKSDLLQMLRILKNYDLLRDAQLDLFRARKKKPPGK